VGDRSHHGEHNGSTSADEHGRLAGEYRAANEHYAWALSELKRNIGAVGKARYDELREAVEDARRQAQACREALGRFHAAKAAE
jgi:hypothetical protein